MITDPDTNLTKDKLLERSPVSDRLIGEILETRMPHKYRLALLYTTLALYILLWLIWISFRDKTWISSVNLSISLFQTKGILWWYSWIFSEPMYKWYFLVFGILLSFAPRKDRAWTSFTTFMLSFLVRQVIRLFVHESRPDYHTSKLRVEKCTCSYGMPSGHSEGITLLYSILLYNFMPAMTKTKHRIVYTSIACAVALSVYFSRIFFGRHSYMQVLLGGCQGALFFFLMLRFEDHLNVFFQRFLANEAKAIKVLWLSCGSICLLLLLSWYFLFDRLVTQVSFYHEVCQICFENDSLEFKKDLGVALMFPFLYFGMVIGTVLIAPQYRLNQNNLEEYKSKILTKQGLYKFLLLISIHMPLLIYLSVDVHSNWKVLLSASCNLGVGFLLGQLPRYCQLLKIDFKGDVISWSTLDGLQF